MSNNDKDFEMCIRAENVVLPKNGYFGVSAATGGGLLLPYRCPALVNPYVNLQLYLHVKKKVQLKVHVKVQMKVPFM